MFKNLLLIIALLATITVTAQEKIAVKMVNEPMSLGTNPGYSVFIPQAELQTVKKNWVKYLESGTKSKVGLSGNEYIIKSVVKKKILTDTLNIYSLLHSEESGTTVLSFFEVNTLFFGPSATIEGVNNLQAENAIREYLRNFAIDQYKLAVKQTLDLAEDTLKMLEKELKNMEKDEASFDKKILGIENKIIDLKSENNNLDIRIKSHHEQIPEKRAMGEGITDNDALKLHNKELKGLEKELTKMEKELNKNEKSIGSFESDIEDYQSEIAYSQKRQTAKKQEITDQETVVARIRGLLRGIK